MNSLETQKNAFAEWTLMKEQANVMIKSGFLPPSVRTAEQCIALFLAGKELGIGFMESVRSINIIQGKPSISPQLMLALVNRAGILDDLKIEADDKQATVTLVRKNRTPLVTKFGVKEATDLGLMGKDNYKKQPRTMFTWRALAANLRLSCPDILLGLYTPEEMGAEVIATDDGEMTVVASREAETRLEDFKKMEVEITERILKETKGNPELGNRILMDLTRHEVGGKVGYILLEDLPRLIETRPAWVEAVLKKVRDNKIGEGE